MSLQMFVLPILLVTVIVLVRAEIMKIKKQIYIFKPLSTVLVIVALLISFGNPAISVNYSSGILAALIFTLFGDVALMFPENEKAFNIGLRLFLLAHIIYGSVFGIFGDISSSIIIPTLIFGILGIAVFNYLKPNLGKMKIPVLVYIIIISLMVVSAFSLRYTIDPSSSIKVIIGAILFYTSDLMLAVNRFGKPWKYNRISLAFYYSGQILIVLSA